MTIQMSDIHGHFINLDRSADRRLAMEGAIARHGLTGVTRFAAIEGDGPGEGITSGELGCFRSHQAIIAAAATASPATLILEDDIVFPERFDDYLAIALRRAESLDWDILFLTQMIAFTDLRSVYQMLRKKRQLGDIHAPTFDRFSVEECRGTYVSGTGAYLIRAGAAAKVAAVLRDAADSGYPTPIDLTLMQAINAGRISAKFVFPYILGVNSGFESTLADRASESNGPLFNDILNLFVAGGDAEHLLERARQASQTGRFDPDAFVVSQILYRRLSR